MDKQIRVTRDNPNVRLPEGKSPHRASHYIGPGQYSADNRSIDNQDPVVCSLPATHATRQDKDVRGEVERLEALYLTGGQNSRETVI
mgnify:CR=1 FL=1